MGQSETAKDTHVIDLAHLRTWIGRTEEADDIVTPRLAAEYRATLEPNLASTGHGDAPWMLQWCLAPPIGPMSSLTDEGHLAKGGFLPPVPLPRRMWAGGAVAVRTPLRVGDTVRRVSRVTDVSLKEGRTGRLCFVTVQHEYMTQGRVAVEDRQDIVYRDAPSTTAAPTAAPAATRSAAPKQVSALSWTVEPTVPYLFRYSALMFNAHRIHYDQPYVTATEGYPGLVVHGPLQASLLFNIATTVIGAPPAAFDYRGLSPLIAPAPFHVRAAPAGDGALRCWTENASGTVCMEARAQPRSA